MRRLDELRNRRAQRCKPPGVLPQPLPPTTTRVVAGDDDGEVTRDGVFSALERETSLLFFPRCFFWLLAISPCRELIGAVIVVFVALLA
jgi:hypothetical protein